MTNTSISLVNLDFDTLKSNLKNYLKSQSIFNDYDFEGSNISVLIDLLTYNTYMYAFYLNMIGSESFLDSAILRDSVVSRAKELNYLPRSFRSASANVTITITPTGNQSSVLMPKGTTFTSRIGSNTYTFSTDQNISLQYSNGIFYANNTLIYEGPYVYDSFVMNFSNTDARYILSNPNIDTSSLDVNIIEDNGQNILTYKQASTLLGVQANSQVYFLQACENNLYELIFGDSIIGRKPKDGATIVAEYRASSGELPNGANEFVPDGAIDNQANISITVHKSADSGAINESIDSIKYYAPRHYSIQERAITSTDYEILLKENFAEINDVSAFGGEEVYPPQYGKVFLSVDISGINSIPDSKKTAYTSFLKQRSPLSIDPVFITADRTYVAVNSTVNYNINLTTLPSNEIKNFVISSILNYNTVNLNGFKTTVRYSKLIEEIDKSHDSIISNDTELLIFKKLVPTNIPTNYTIEFNTPLKIKGEAHIHDVHSFEEEHVLLSTRFMHNGQLVSLEDDGRGVVRTVIRKLSLVESILDVGTIDYESGTVKLFNFDVESIEGNSLKIYVRTQSKDYSSTKNSVLVIDQEDINLTINQLRE